MSTNYLLSNNGVPQPVFSQSSITPQRTRAVSACSTPGIPVASHYHPTFSQAYQTLAPMDSWAQTQQGVYVNGLGKVMNVFTGGTMSEMDDIMLNQTNETYKFTHGMKLPNVGPQPGGHLYQQPSALTGGTHHATLQTLNPQIQLALAAAPNGVTQSPTNVPTVPANSLRTDQPNVIQSAIPHQHQTSAPGQSLFIPRLVGQQTVPHHPNPASPSVFTETMGTGSGMPTFPPYHTKHVPSLNGPNTARSLPAQVSTTQPPLTPQNYASGLPIAQQHAAPHPSHHQLYSAANLPPPAPHLSSAMPPGIVEFLPAMFPPDPNTQSQFSQQSAAVFGHQYASQMASTYVPSSGHVDTPYSARVRHNTWSGLESTIAFRSLDQTSGDKISTNLPSLGHATSITNDASRTVPLRSHTSDNTVPFISSNHPYNAATGRSSSLYFPGANRPGVIELPPSIGLTAQGSVQFSQPRDRDVCNTNSGNPHAPAAKTNKSESDVKSTTHWGGTSNTMRQQPQWTVVSSHTHNPLLIADPLNSNTAPPSDNVYNSSTTGAQHRCIGTSQSNRDAFRKGRDGEPQSTGGTHSSQLMSNRTRSGLPVGLQTSKSHGQALSGIRQLPAGKPFGSIELETNKQLQSQLSALGLNGVVNSPGLVTASNSWNIATNPVTHSANLGRLPHPVGVRFPQGLLSHQALPFLFQNPTANLDPSQFHRQRFPQALRRLGLSDPGTISVSPGMGDLLRNGLPQLNGLRYILDSCPTRVLISTALVGAVIGRGGRTIRSITSKTGAQIDFKQETVAFSQFALQSGLRNFNASRSNASSSVKSTVSNGADSLKTDEGDGKDVAEQTENRPASPSSPPPSTTANGPPLNRSQIVLIFGSREQCSTALAEMLAVCFRESEHKGLSDPCLGLLIQQQIYSQLLMGHGRKYFNRIHAATGARVTVTGTPAHVEPIKPDGPASSARSPSTDANMDRIVVVRGQLPAICAAEAYISEHVRCITAEQIIPPTLWPLLPHLPLASLASSTHASGTGRARHSASGTDLSDLRALTNVVLSIADVFWPHSVSAKLSKHSSFSQSSHSAPPPTSHTSDEQERDKSVQQPDVAGNTEDGATSVQSGPTITRENNLNDVSLDDADSTVLDEVSSSSNDIIVDGFDSNALDSLDDEGKELIADCHQEDDERPPTPTPISNKESPTPNTLEESNDFETHTHVKSLSAAELGLVADIRNSLHEVMGPAAWIATSGMLHMRVSFNEAGILIGAGGHRIHQLIQSTGSDIYIGKTPINGPYSLNQTNRLNRTDSAEKTRRLPAKLVSTAEDSSPEFTDPNESILTTNDVKPAEDQKNERESPSKSPLISPQSVIPDSASDNEPTLSGASAPTVTTPQPPIAPDSPDLEKTEAEHCGTLLADSGNETKMSPATASAGDQTIEPTPNQRSVTVEDESVNHPDSTMEASPEVNRSDSTKVNSSNTSLSSSSSYRLVTLSGPFESQLLAHWRIFDRLSMLHHRQHMIDATESSHSEAINSTIDPSHSKVMPPLRLATLICMPYRFLCWFTSGHSGFESLVSGVPSDSSEASSPLSWLQSKAMGMMQRYYEDGTCAKVIHVLPEPRRRRRLVQQQLRRAGLSRRGPAIMSSPPLMSNAKPIFLPSVGLTHDGLDQLWSDPNRVPVEIFADHETTTVVVMWLKHLLAVWLYGQALANPSGFNSFTQMPSLFMVPRSPVRLNQNQNSRAMNYHANDGSPHNATDWAHGYFPAVGSAVPVSDHRSTLSSTGRRPFNINHPTVPDFYGRQQRPRYPAFGNKWHQSQDHASLPFLTDQSRMFGSHPFNAYTFSGPMTPEPVLASAAFGSTSGSYSHNPVVVHPSGTSTVGPPFTHSWPSIPFVWDHASFLNRPFNVDPPRRQSSAMPHRRNQSRRSAATSSAGTVKHTEPVVSQPIQSEVPESVDTAKSVAEPTNEE
ncbi:hypothetical protein CSKR_111744 [Clonorchis sinensis]|uniref:K Homology domain-containing protein n=1 Tax=Clonorchis sinensis TaxID=79923 RepID=A0A419QEL5_CLOSI|nr:hypothetical protein CSKR_111744 [Clonorchis sinensis]